jgi:hypothetical protein
MADGERVIPNAEAEWFNDRTDRATFGSVSVSPEEASGVLGVPPLPTEAPPKPENAPLEADLRTSDRPPGPADPGARAMGASTPMGESPAGSTSSLEMPPAADFLATCANSTSRDRNSN